LTVLRADAIVNAANDRMLGCFVPGHVCIDNVIHAAAGPALREECAEHMRAQGHPEPTGVATLTGGYHLPASFVIHTVGPIVPSHQPTPADEAALASCYRSILDTAEGHGGIHTIGFCAISTGVFGYPKDAGARVAISTIRDWLTEHPDTRIEPIVSAFTPADEAVYLDAIAEVLR
jgi:O-acetyl-ADP-ribose deacetylase (regulator of RNase III)